MKSLGEEKEREEKEESEILDFRVNIQANLNVINQRNYLATVGPDL